MKKILSFFYRNEDYKEQVNQYTKFDSLFAFILFAIMIAFYTILGLLNRFEFVSSNSILFGCIFNSLLIIITIVFVKAKHQSLKTIGLVGGRFKMSLLFGGIAAIILLFLNCLQYLFQGFKLVDIQTFFIYLIYYFLIAFSEELVFRGYIATRLYGLIKYRVAVIIVSGILFVIMHYPFKMAAGGANLLELVLDVPGNLNLFITHIWLNFIFEKTNSIYGALLAHTTSNFSYSIVVRN